MPKLMARFRDRVLQLPDRLTSRLVGQPEAAVREVLKTGHRLQAGRGRGDIIGLHDGPWPCTPRSGSRQPFPSRPVAAVNSPVDVTVNGKAADVLAATGFPGTVDGIR